MGRTRAPASLGGQYSSLVIPAPPPFALFRRRQQEQRQRYSSGQWEVEQVNRLLDSLLHDNATHLMQPDPQWPLENTLVADDKTGSRSEMRGSRSGPVAAHTKILDTLRGPRELETDPGAMVGDSETEDNTRVGTRNTSHARFEALFTNMVIRSDTTSSWSSPRFRALRDGKFQGFATVGPIVIFSSRAVPVRARQNCPGSVPLPFIGRLRILELFAFKIRCTISEDATRHAIYVLCHISDRSAASVVDANILANVEPLLDSTDPRVFSYTCCLLGNLQRQMPNVISGELKCRLTHFLMASEGADVRTCLAAAYALGYWGLETRYDR
ncbi:hypothetical protein DFH06DRAFT_1147012 [Mycena polygramma]|nr:hypothetical protein DFH06DRAFT_1147012 [Mycena polygramma]